jgi:Flp pilus assembly protein TadG
MIRSNWRTHFRRAHSESGSTMVETALCATLFLLFLFGVINFGYLFYSRVTLQNAVRQAARYAITGNCSSGTCLDSGKGTGDRLNTIIQTVKNYSFNLSPTVTVTCIQGSCPGYSGDGTNNAGGPGDVVQVSATYTFSPVVIMNFIPKLSSVFPYTYTVSASFRNELFPPPSN